ncbi:hypothetical protein JDS98_17090 [Bacillus cereus group sp. N11]|nr:hypothetical protein [Bacillus cereus group sp. N11]
MFVKTVFRAKFEVFVFASLKMHHSLPFRHYETVNKQYKPKRELSYEEVKLLLNYYKNNEINYALFSVLATTGLRVAEIAHARNILNMMIYVDVII